MLWPGLELNPSLPYRMWLSCTQYAFNLVRIGYNYTDRILHNIPRFTSASEGRVAAEIPTFQAFIRRNVLRYGNDA